MPSTAIRDSIAAHARRVVVKVGTNAICDSAGRPDRKAITSLAGQIAELMRRDLSVVLVASGAIGAGLAELGLTSRPHALPQLQACAAVGQGQLMRIFHDTFARRHLRVAQVLLTREDFEHRSRYLNIRNTLHALGDCGALPIVNENDTVAVDEIRFGENDILAALVTTMLGADVLVFLTGAAGVLQDGEVLDVIEQVDETTYALVREEKTALGSGGMASKLSAAQIVTRCGEVVFVADSTCPDVLVRLMSGEKLGTCFVPAGRKMSSRQRWIDHVARPAGRIYVDGGAARALGEEGRSLLPSGIVRVEGCFVRGSTVRVLDGGGREIARGLVNYASDEIDRIKGLRSSELQRVLGERPYDEVIHRDNLSTSASRAAGPQ